MPSSRLTEYGHMAGSRGGDCGISGNPPKLDCRPRRMGTLEVADHGDGGPKPVSERSLCSMRSFIFNQCRDRRIGVM